MKPILGYIARYFYESNKLLLVQVMLFTGLLICLNYQFEIDNHINDYAVFFPRFLCRYAIYLTAFGFPYLLCMWLTKQRFFRHRNFCLLLFTAPAIFSIKAGHAVTWKLSTDPIMNIYWNHVLYWPILLLFIGIVLFAFWRLLHTDQPFYGTSGWNMVWKPSGLMLLVMVPLITTASLQPDFMAIYPKLKLILDADSANQLQWWHKLLFELSYGSDFIGIELFFRGFLVLAFIKWAGKDSILAMACFYCTIHFGKPLWECITSFFGGLLLGIIISNTRSLWGGLLVHLGIAWSMELAGYLSTYYLTARGGS